MFFMSAETESSSATRPSLLARLKDWSQQTAWREFDHDYAPLLRNVARKAGLADVEADEVVQETLIAVAKKIGEFQHAGNRGSFRAWLYQQARWRIADQFRVRGRVNSHQTLGHVLPADERGTEGEGKSNDAADSPVDEPSDTSAPELDPVFERLWNAEWDEHVRQSALARV